MAAVALLLVAGVFALWLEFLKGAPPMHVPLQLLAAMTLLAGIPSIQITPLAKVIMRTWYEAQGRPVYLVKSTRNLDARTS